MEYAADINLYRYVYNDPINCIDPYGEDTYYINNWINFNDTTSATSLPVSHSFVAVTDRNSVTGKEVVTATYSWVATNGGMWECSDAKKNMEGAQQAIDTGVGAWKKGDEFLDSYVEQLFNERKNEKGGFWPWDMKNPYRGVCKMQANRLIDDAIKKKLMVEALHIAIK